MPDSAISDLPLASTIGDEDSFVMQQGSSAKKVKGKQLTSYINRNIINNVDVTTVEYGSTAVSTFDKATGELHMQVNNGPGIFSVVLSGQDGNVDTYSVLSQEKDENDEYKVIGTFTVRNWTINNQKYLYDLIYPVGSIFMTASHNFDPSETFGGTWAQIEDKFLVGFGDVFKNVTPQICDYDTERPRYKDCESVSDVQHTLTVSEMPAHDHSSENNESNEYVSGTIGYPTNNGTNYGGYTVGWYSSLVKDDGVLSQPIKVQEQGGGEAFDILPPYQAVYIWQRTSL